MSLCAVGVAAVCMSPNCFKKAEGCQLQITLRLFEKQKKKSFLQTPEKLLN